MIDHKEQRYEIAVEIAHYIKQYYDDAYEKQDDFNQGYLTGLETAYRCFRNRLLTYDDIDEEKLTSLGVADELWNVSIKDDDKHRAQEF